MGEGADMISYARNVASRTAYRVRALQTYHHFVNRNTLTVAMFHHVVPRGTREWEDASKTWTVSAEVFENCIQFFAQQYEVVSMARVIEAAAGKNRLPDRSLLITFDDGWQDNELHALPVLRRHGVPAALFAVSGWIGKVAPWNHVAMRAWEEGALSAELCTQWWNLTGGDPVSAPRKWDRAVEVHTLIMRLAALTDDERQQMLGMIPNGNRFAGDCIASREQLVHLEACGVAVESHGWTHLPIALTPDPRQELRQSRAQLAREVLETRSNGPATISFPHGSYDASVVEIAREEGYELQFTSDACINRCVEGRPPRLLGRIPVFEHEVTDSTGRFRADRMARWFFRRSVRTLNPPLEVTGGA